MESVHKDHVINGYTEPHINHLKTHVETRHNDSAAQNLKLPGSKTGAKLSGRQNRSLAGRFCLPYSGAVKAWLN